MKWRISYAADPVAAAIADRHYSRQTPGSAQFAPPGRKLVLIDDDALWVSWWPFSEYVKHAWPGAWVCSLFRNEGAHLSSDLIREALAATLWRWPEPPDLGMVTFVERSAVRPKRNPGYCFLKAGFEPVGRTKSGLHALRIKPENMPSLRAPLNSQMVFA